MAGTKKIGKKFYVVHERTRQVLRKRNPVGGFSSRSAAESKADMVEKEIMRKKR